MKKQNLWLLINAFILLTLSVIYLVVYQTTIPKEPKDYLFSEVVELGEAEVVTPLPTIGYYTVIHTVQTATNRQGEVVGTVYHVITRNGFKIDPKDEFGYIDLLIGIDVNNKVWVQSVTINQTSTYVGGIQDYVYEYFQGIEFSDLILIPIVNVGDLESAASVSTGTVKSMVGMVINYHSTNNELAIGEVIKK